MKPGQIVSLINPQGKNISVPKHTLAVIVNGPNRFPELYQKLVNILEPQDINEFIAVEWVDSPQQADGFYSKWRFEVKEYEAVRA